MTLQKTTLLILSSLCALAHGDNYRNTSKLSTLTSDGYLASASTVATGTDSAQFSRIVVRNPSGALVWSRDFGSNAYTSYVPAQIQADASGNVCVVGAKRAERGSEFAEQAIYYTKYSRTGVLLQSHVWNPPGGSNYFASGLVLGSDGAAYMVGRYTDFGSSYTGVIMKVTASGSGTRTTYTYPGYEITQIAINSLNDALYLSGTVLATGNNLKAGRVVRHSSVLSNGPLWSNQGVTGYGLTNPGLVVDPFISTTPYALFVARRQQDLVTGVVERTTVSRYNDQTGAGLFSAYVEAQDGVGTNDGSAGLTLDVSGRLVVGGIERVGTYPNVSALGTRLLRFAWDTGVLLSNESGRLLNTRALALDTKGQCWFVGEINETGSPTGLGLVWSSRGTPRYEYRFNTGLGSMGLNSVLVPYATAADVDDFYVAGRAAASSALYPYQVRRGPNVNFEYIQNGN